MYIILLRALRGGQIKLLQPSEAERLLPQLKGTVEMAHKYISEPVVEYQIEKPYAAIAFETADVEWEEAAELVSEIIEWLGKRKQKTAGTALYRYWCTGGGGELSTLEVGVPVDRMSAGDERVVISTIPGGTYLKAVHRGHPDNLPESHEAMVKWAQAEGLEFDKRWEAEYEIWNGRFDIFLTDPQIEPDPEKWEIEILLLLVRDEAA